MSEWPHARPGASRRAHRPDLAGHEALPPVSPGHSRGGAPLPRIQHGQSSTRHTPADADDLYIQGFFFFFFF